MKNRTYTLLPITLETNMEQMRQDLITNFSLIPTFSPCFAAFYILFINDSRCSPYQLPGISFIHIHNFIFSN